MKKVYKSSEFEESLHKYGLTHKQSRLYIAALKTGPAPLQKIADGAKLGRTNAYDAIHALVAKGLVSISMNGKRHMYVAQPPKMLKKLLRDQELELDELIPQLEVFNGQTEFKPKILFYPGIEGYKMAYEDSLTAPDKQLFGIFSAKATWEVLGRDYVDRAVEKRVKKGIHLRVIHPSVSRSPGTYPSSSGNLRDMRVSPEGMDFSVSTYVYGNKVMILSSKNEMFGMIIESADIANAHRNYFEALWQISTPDRKPSL
jgi:HTH-type transcriptional regulator, sugar sensing transcriptional regulator